MEPELDRDTAVEGAGTAIDTRSAVPPVKLHPLGRLRLPPAEEVEHPLGEERGGVRVVGRQ